MTKSIDGVEARPVHTSEALPVLEPDLDAFSVDETI
jgi:hypothetical protein